MYEAIEGFPSQVSQTVPSLPKSITSYAGTVQQIVCCGMGGSAFPLEIIRLMSERSVSIHRDYSDTLDEPCPSTLYLILSFSGNTEEALDCAQMLKTNGAKLLVISNGGRLSSFASESDIPTMGFPLLPNDFQPRCATGYFLSTVLAVTDALGLTHQGHLTFRDACNFLNDKRDAVEQKAQSLAAFIQRRICVVLGYEPYAAIVGRIGRIKLNENAKQVALVDTLPEFNHNQMEALCAQGDELDVVMLQGNVGDPRKTRRQEVTCETLRAAGANVCVLTLEGHDELTRCLFGIWTLDFASIFLAKIRDVDPLSIDAIETFKSQLGA